MCVFNIVVSSALRLIKTVGIVLIFKWQVSVLNLSCTQVFSLRRIDHPFYIYILWSELVFLQIQTSSRIICNSVSDGSKNQIYNNSSRLGVRAHLLIGSLSLMSCCLYYLSVYHYLLCSASHIFFMSHILLPYFTDWNTAERKCQVVKQHYVMITLLVQSLQLSLNG